MNKLKLAVWVLVLANAGMALAGLCLSVVCENVFARVLEGKEAIPDLTVFYFGHRVLVFTVLALLPPIAALLMTVRRSITSEVVLLFGAVTVLLIALQMLLAVLAVGRPFYNHPIMPFPG